MPESDCACSRPPCFCDCDCDSLLPDGAGLRHGLALHVKDAHRLAIPEQEPGAPRYTCPGAHHVADLAQVSVFRTLLDVVSGMQYLHGLGLVHG